MTLSLLILGLAAALDATPDSAPQAAAPAPSASAPARQDPPPRATPATDPDLEGTEVEAVQVTAGKPRGSVEGDIKPELTLGPAQIRAYGAGSISELMAFLEPQLRTARAGATARR